MALVDYEGKHPKYAYYLSSTEPLEEKLAALYEYLSRYKDDTNFKRSGSGGGPDEAEVWNSWIVSTLDDAHPVLMIQLTQESQSSNRDEVTALEETWIRALELMCKLHARWDGSGFFVGRQRSLKCKQMVLEEFFTEYKGDEFSVDPAFKDNSALRIVATGSFGSTALVVEYHPEKPKQASELQALVRQYQV